MQQKTVKSKKTVTSKQKKEVVFPLGKENFVIIGAGVLTLIIGYVLMSQNSVDGFLNTVIAPIVLLIGYCVIIPYGILKRPKELAEVPGAGDLTVDSVTTTSTASSVSSNVKTS